MILCSAAKRNKLCYMTRSKEMGVPLYVLYGKTIRLVNLEEKLRKILTSNFRKREKNIAILFSKRTDDMNLSGKNPQVLTHNTKIFGFHFRRT